MCWYEYDRQFVHVCDRLRLAVPPESSYLDFPLGCVLPLALLSNGVRVAFIYVLGVKGGTELAMGHWHELSGFFAFLPTLLGVYLVTSLTHLRFDATKKNSMIRCIIIRQIQIHGYRV